ncbi:NADH dehydrogenase [Fusarium austroafricanum]|uniref:NADH dehydrogenase [ubiquinone] 1 alpha subcomplex subunit 13 n=1 Tax=Fusarium austroafricanum TaxID=2364996 RepID=A0A8H4KA88_9HYPO|nr:NADH dehydrogenase [Fusarium austroafricanum]
MPQDMPPRGGYEPVQYKRNLPAKGFRPGILLLGMGAVMGYGWYKLIGGMREAKCVLYPPSPISSLSFYNQSTTYNKRRQFSNTYEHTNHATVYEQKLTSTSELGREKMWARINLIPLLQAEEDRDQVRRYLADQKREKELLGDNAKIYNSDRFVRPTFAVTPPPTTN